MTSWHVAPLPFDEAKRLHLLHSLAVLDTPVEEAFDRLTRVAAETLQVPIALVSLVDHDRQWFKSRVGLDASETSRDVSFCSHVVHSRRALVIEDALSDERFAGNPLVTGAPFVRFYAGVPLRSSEGYVLGTLCAIDTQARKITPSAQAALCDLATMVERELLQREAARATRDVQENDRRKLRLSESRFHTIFQQTPTGKAIVDMSGRFVEVNPKLCEITGYEADDLLNMTFQDITVEADLPSDLKQIAELIHKQKNSYTLEKRYRRKDGSTVWVDVASHSSVMTSGHYIWSLSCRTSRVKHSEQLLRDYQQELERRVLERTSELASSRAALQTITDNLPVLIAHVDTDLRYRFNNEMHRRIFGVEPGALRGRQAAETLGVALHERCIPFMRRALAGECITQEDIVYEQAPERTWSATYIPEVERGEIVGLYIMSQDITERKELEERMKSAALLDALTSLPNRRALQEQLESAVVAARDNDTPFALFFMDLDGFKNVNDVHGHGVGDELLKEVAARLRKTTRGTDLVCRLAGDEFVVVAQGVSSTSACSRIAQDICHAISRPFQLGELHARIGTSVGIALCQSGSTVSADTIIADADKAMYEAKRKGRNGFRFASSREGRKPSITPPTVDGYYLLSA